MAGAQRQSENPVDGGAATGPTAAVAVFSVAGDKARAQADRLAVEEPLEIRVRAAGAEAAETLSLTMRTPGRSDREDLELALGFLFTEGLLGDPRDAADVKSRTPAPNVIELELKGGLRRAPGLVRHFYTTSACGVCGKTALESLAATPRWPLPPAGDKVPAAVIHGLGKALREAQAAFESTGGLHAAGLFDASGRLLGLREDVGRHNAVDKLLGAALLSGSLPLSCRILLVSGRASFELVQKARMAGIPMLVAVGAPSSLAVQLSREAGMTLIGFARDDRCNVYSAPERVAMIPMSAESPSTPSIIAP
jgi:FdhD protein